MKRETPATPEAMKNVALAHQALEGFAQELAALFQIVDDVLAESESGLPLVPVRESLFSHPSAAPKIRLPKEWFPSWFGRFYEEEPVNDGEQAEKAVAGGQRTLAFVWVAVREERRKQPEIWIGVADVQREDPSEESDKTARALWDYSEEIDIASQEKWVEGKWPGNRFGFAQDGGTWAIQALPLARLVDEEAVRELVALPVRQRVSRSGRSRR